MIYLAIGAYTLARGIFVALAENTGHLPKPEPEEIDPKLRAELEEEIKAERAAMKAKVAKEMDEKDRMQDTLDRVMSIKTKVS